MYYVVIVQKYIVAFNLPTATDREIRKSYKQIYDKDVPIDNLHLTIFPPFSLVDTSIPQVKNQLRGGVGDQFPVRLGRTGFFKHQGKKILFIIVKPGQFLEEYHAKLISKIEGKVKFDTSIYKEAKVPKFLPHISLDYDFSFPESTLDSLEAVLPKGYFNLIGPKLYIQKELGKWEEVDEKNSPNTSKLL